MKSLTRLAAAVFVLLAPAAALALADDAPKSAADHGAAVAADLGKSGAGIGAGIGAGLTIVGAGIGIGLVGWAALSGIARQPEAAGTIQVNMIIMAALVEGVAIISLLVICFALVGRI